MSSFLLKCQAKSLSAHMGDENHHGFLVGTCNLRGPNELRLLRYYEDDDEIECITAYTHPRGEILQVSPCPFDATIVATVYSSMSGEIGSAIWKLNSLPMDDSNEVENSLKQSNQRSGDNNSGSNNVDNSDFLGMSPHAQSLELIAELPFPKDATNQIVNWSPLGFHPVNQTTEFVTVDLVNGVSVFELALPSSDAKNGVGMLVPKTTVPLLDVGFLGGVNWDPHHPSEIAIACDSMVLIVDIKSATVVRTITSVVPQGCVIRSISYNPNKPWFLATGGDDYLCKIWDIRRPHLPVKILAGHTHWVTCVAFNPFHDQLILTSSSDGKVGLWSISSVSSAPLLELGDEEIDPETGEKVEPKLAPDVPIKMHENEQNESVSCVAWSNSNAWAYASLSHSGRVAVAQVPTNEKYRVLL